MSRVGAFVDNFMAHYASEYYDPVKAREYYLRTRELKGDQPNTSDLTVKNGKKVDKVATDRKKQAWAYAKNQIGEAKKASLKGLSEARKGVVDKARESTHARREEISNKLTGLLDLLTKQKATDAASVTASEKAELSRVDKERADKERKIRDAANREIDGIPAVPDSVRGPARERLVAARAKKVARITGNAAREIGAVQADAATQSEAISADAESKRKALSTQTQEEKASERASASANRERVTTELKATVEKARADYEAGKERVIADYKAKAMKEFTAIKTRV